MKTMKFSMKVLMAMLLFCLPFAITSCGSDDDEETGPKTYTYSYQITQSNADPQDIIAIQAIFDKALKTIGTVEGNEIANKKLKVTANSETESKAMVSARVETILLTAHQEALALTLNTTGKITVKVSGNDLNWSKKY